MEKISRINDRSSNFELLRILAMLLIVALHSVYFGVQFGRVGGGNLNFYVSTFVGGFCGGVGNYLFVLISSYFICTSSFSGKRLFAIWWQVFFYSAVIGLFFFVSKIPTIGFYDRDAYDSLGFFAAAKPAGKIDLIRSFLPVLMGNNWFATCYIVFYLFTPALNKLVAVIDRRMHLYLVFLITFLGTVVSFIPGQGLLHPSNFYHFVTAYFIASYIKMYSPRIFDSAKRNLILGALVCVLCGLWNCAVECLAKRYGVVRAFSRFLLLGNIDKFPILLAAVLIFAGFRKLSIPRSRVINTVASTTFGVYLIHVNGLLKIFLWHRLLKCDSFAYSAFYPLYLVVSVLLVFAVCAGIDLLVRQPLERLFLRIKARTARFLPRR